MVNCNPETVSTDDDTSDRLYFEPLTVEDVLEVVEREQPVGVVVQFGGQTPLRLARRLEEAGVPILGTPFDAIDLAEDRERFGSLLAELGLQAPDWGIAGDADEAVAIATAIGYPVLVRPSYVLGGRAMRICYDESTLRVAAGAAGLARRPLRRGRDRGRRRRGLRRRRTCDRRGHGARRGGRRALGRLGLRDPAAVAGRARSSARSARQTARSPQALGVRGLINVQFAVQGSAVYVIEANPRASRTVPFVCQGDRPRPGRGRLPGGARPARSTWPRREAEHIAREGGGAAVPALPRRRPDARPGDALDRRGDGHRARLPDGLRQGRARRRAAAARATGRGVPLGARPRQAGRHDAGRAAAVARLRPGRDRRAPPARCSGSASRWRRCRR